MKRLLTFNVSVSNANLKYSIGKSIFVVNLPLKIFRATVANDNTESLKSFNTLFDTYLDYMLAEFESNSIVGNVQNVGFWTKKKNEFFKNILTKC